MTNIIFSNEVHKDCDSVDLESILGLLVSKKRHLLDVCCFCFYD